MPDTTSGNAAPNHGIRDGREALQEQQYFLPYHFMYAKNNFIELLYDSYVRLVLDLAEKTLQTRPGASLLDAGSGDGRFLFEASKRFPSARLYGLDLSDRALSFARFYNPQASFAHQELSESGFSNGQFAVVTCIETIEHLPPAELPAVAREFARILAPDGRLIVTVPSSKLPVSKKHYQHFDRDSLARQMSPLVLESCVGHDLRPWPLTLFNRLMENRFFSVNDRRLRDARERLFLRRGRTGPVEKANQLIAVFRHA